MIVQALALLVSLSSFSAVAGAESGGGGGGICKGNKCITLAEAGFKFTNPTNPNYEFSYQVIKELDDINSKLPLKISTEAVIGKPGDVVVVEVSNDRRVKKFLKDYQSLLVANGSADLSKRIELLAFTNGKKTYLIREKYESLDTRSQALLLLHECKLRVMGMSLTEALKTDIATVDYLKALESNRIPNLKNYLAAQFDTSKMSSDYSDYLLHEVLKGYGINEAGSVIMRKHISYKNSFSLSYRDILEIKQFIPAIADYIAPGEYTVEQKTDRSSIVHNFVESTLDHLRSSEAKKIIISNESFNNFVNKNYPDRLSVLDLCGGINEIGYRFSLNQNNSDLQRIQAVNCYVSNFEIPSYTLRNSRTEITGNISFLDGMTGLNLNLAKDVVCTLTLVEKTIDFGIKYNLEIIECI